MKKPISNYQFNSLYALYLKLNNRLKRHFSLGRFQKFTKKQQYKLLARLEKLKNRLSTYEQYVKLTGAAFVLGASLMASESNAQQLANLGSEFRVNTYTTDNQLNKSVAVDSDGDFVVTWASVEQIPGSNLDVFAQRYNADGVPQGSEFQVNTYTTSAQNNPVVAMDNVGNFVITWQSAMQDGSGDAIYAKRYDASGVVQGAEFRVNTYTILGQEQPAIAMDADGDFAISWISTSQDGDSYGVYAQRFNATAVAQGSEFRVNTITTAYQGRQSIAMDDDGDFIVTFMSSNQDGDGGGIFAKKYNASGVLQGSEFLVNTYTTGDQGVPEVAMDSDGDFVITWTNYDPQDGSYFGIYAKRYNASGVVQGSEFLVNTYTTGNQRDEAIAMDDNGAFTITWKSNNQDGSNDGIYAKRYDNTGLAVGLEFKVNTYTTNNQTDPSIAMDSDGDFVISWESYAQESNFYYGVFAQRYTVHYITGIEDAIGINKQKIYPNPTKDFTNLKIDGEATVRLIDLTGSIISETKVNNDIVTFQGLKSGLYLIETIQSGQKTIQKLVVE